MSFLRIIKFLVLVLGLPFGFLVIFILLGVSPIVVNVLSTMSIAYVYAALLFLLFNLGSKKRKFNKKISLYHWMDELIDYDEPLTYSLKLHRNKYKTIDNMNYIKSVILTLTKGEVETLRLYKVFYSQATKETGEELYFRSVLALFSSVTVYLLKDYISEISKVDINNGFLFVLIIFITIATITGKLSTNKKRDGLILDIIDICIEEIDKKNKTSDANM